jgi:hypothetical protein
MKDSEEQSELRTTENTKRVRTTVGRSPKRSAHRYSMARNISSNLHQRILQSDLHFYPPQKIHCTRTVRPWFCIKKCILCAICYRNARTSYVIRRFIMSNESHFELSACVNKQNVRNWSEANPNGLYMKQINKEEQYGLGYRRSVSLVPVLSRMKLAVLLLWHLTGTCI